MLPPVLSITLSFLVIVVLVIVTVRLRLYDRSAPIGRVWLLSASVLLAVASAWQSIKSLPAYSEWFLDSAYPILDVIHFILLAVSLVCVVLGLVRLADYWRSREQTYSSRHSKYALLEDLQQEGSQPYQLMDLLSLVVKAIIAHMPECASAVFLLNRTQREFVLASAAGLSKEETAALEHYPLQGNQVSQAVETGEPLLTNQFSFAPRTAAGIGLRFHSSLVLPLESGMERIGGILLFSEQEKYFSPEVIRMLRTVAGWLAERIKTTRLSRELSTAKQESEQLQESSAETGKRLGTLLASHNATHPIDSFCHGLVGFARCQTAHVYGLKQGEITFYGASDRLEALSENFKTALVDALDRERPLIVNQESPDESGRSVIAYSSLVIPLSGDHAGKAMLLRKESTPFQLSPSELKSIELFAALAGQVLSVEHARSQAFSQRKGLQTVSHLLTMDTASSLSEEWKQVADHLDELLPPHQSRHLVFLRSTDGRYQLLKRDTSDSKTLSEIRLRATEGQLAELERSGEVRSLAGGLTVTHWFDTFDSQNKTFLKDVLTEHGVPQSVVVLPVIGRERMHGFLLVAFRDMSEKQIGEWERLLKLLCGLVSVRLHIREVETARGDARSAVSLPQTSEELINRLNNYLAGILGNAELLTTDRNLSTETRENLEKIIAEVESASRLLRAAAGRPVETDKQAPTPSLKPTVLSRISDLLTLELQKAHISENVYMLSGRPREVELKIEDVGEISLASEAVRQILNGALERFTSLATDDDIIVLKLYRRDDFAFFDISRHQKHFPAVESVAGFGEYLPPADVVKRRPADTYLRLLGDTESQFSYDRFGDAPTYLSFKLPLAGRKTTAVMPKPNARILAIDDHAVILDLISAMCQSLGFEVQTASSAEAGVELAQESSFDLILTDLAMPDMSGLEAARRIRHLHPTVPIILVTGWEVSLSEAELEAAGVTSVLNKPFRIEQLTDVIRNALTAGSVS